MIGDRLKDSKVRWAVQQAHGEMTQVFLQTEDLRFANQVENIARSFRLIVEDAEDEENDD